jgi:hypothetical protein
MALGSTQPLVKMCTRNIPGGKGGRCVSLTTSSPSRAECHEIWEPKPPGIFYDCLRAGWSGGGGGGFSATVQTGPQAHPTSCTMGIDSFPGVRCGRGVRLTTNPLLVPRSKIEKSSNSTLLKALPGLWKIETYLCRKLSSTADNFYVVTDG